MNQEKLLEIKKAFIKSETLFTALGDKVRQRIIVQLMEAGFSGLSVNDLTRGQNLSRSTISHHLKILKESGILGIREQGTYNYYHLNIQQPLAEGLTLLNMITDFINTREFLSERAKFLTR